MKKNIVFLCISLLVSTVILSQTDTSTANKDTVWRKTTYAKSLELFAYPAKGQTPKQQELDEKNCYQWAIDESGVDPMNMPNIKAATPATEKSGGEAVKGAARGAAAGAVIGAVAGDAGTGAAVGAVAGGMGGVGKRKAKARKERQEAVESIEAQEDALMEKFKKAFSVCMEGKGYTIK